MMIISKILVLVILIWTFLYTLSYGSWNWKKKNRIGAVMVYLLAVAVLVIPGYMVFVRK